MKHWVLFFLLAASTFVPLLECFAGSNLDCIAASKGRRLLWNASWENDRTDNNVEYRVTDVSEIDKIPTRQVTLELQAVDSASSKTRRAVVSTEEYARAICERFIENKAPLRFPGQIETQLDSLPFIRYSKDGWVRGAPDPSDTLGICRLGQLRFSCPENDRQRFGATLKSLEEELKAQVPAETLQ